MVQAGCGMMSDAENWKLRDERELRELEMSIFLSA